MNIYDDYAKKDIDIKNLRIRIKKLEQENKKLKADTEHTIKFNNKIIGELKLENDKLKVIIKNNDIEQKADWKHIEELEAENKKLKNSKICWKTVEERIEIDKGVVIGKY